MTAPFRRRSNGTGWEPATAKGWAIMLGFVVLVVAPSLGPGWLDAGWALAGFFAYVAVLTAGFLLLCHRLSA
ncbi:hypothetical protein GCM10011345_06110 [Gemmobacter megaterium]|nr:hypothetical protein [Gemmobacter megaterium]GGE03429.1 hypothetical protein GCM10011345_06110 [Gemmobacter megaterium]